MTWSNMYIFINDSPVEFNKTVFIKKKVKKINP